jgi:hypothetical protein
LPNVKRKPFLIDFIYSSAGVLFLEREIKNKTSLGRFQECGRGNSKGGKGGWDGGG